VLVEPLDQTEMLVPGVLGDRHEVSRRIPVHPTEVEPEHPASGEEAFVVDRVPGGDVRATIVAFSRPRHPLARLGAPVMRRQQVAATDGYLDALRRHVAVSRDRDPGPSAG